MADTFDFHALGDNLVDAVRGRFKDFLAENKDVDNFVTELGRRYATLSARYHLAGSEEERAEALADLRRVENTMELELDAIGHLAKSEILGQLKAALGVALKFAVENLPTVLAMIKR